MADQAGQSTILEGEKDYCSAPESNIIPKSLLGKNEYVIQNKNGERTYVVHHPRDRTETSKSRNRSKSRSNATKLAPCSRFIGAVNYDRLTV